MGTGVNVWSKTAASNNTADSAVNWQEGQAPSSVNDSARGMMASVAKWRDDLNGSLVLGGTSSAYTLTTNQGFAALAAGLQVAFQVNVGNAVNPTLAVDGLAAKPIRSQPGSGLYANQFLAGGIYRATYFTSNSGEWIIESYPYLGDLQVSSDKLAANSVTTTKIADANVTLAKIENRTANTLIGRYTASTGVPQEVTVGAGLLLNTSTGALTAPAFPPPGSFSNLSIKVASNTTVTVTGNVTVTDGSGSYKTVTLNSTVDLGTNGAVNRLDAGTIASSTWYALHAVDTPAGAPGVIASTSATSPTMPSGYTYKARIGWVRTVSGSAQLYGTWQLGKRAQYVVGLAQTTNIVPLASGVAGTYSQISPVLTTVGITGVVPTTASEIILNVGNQVNNGMGSNVLIAPSTAYGGTNNGPTGSNNQMWPLFMNASQFLGNLQVNMLLESTSTVAWASSAAGGCVSIAGWVDNI